jgi:hypothetical protein
MIGPGQAAEGLVKKTMDAEASETLGKGCRASNVDKQDEPAFFSGRVVTSGDEMKKRTGADDVGDREQQVQRHGKYGRENNGCPGILIGVGSQPAIRTPRSKYCTGMITAA